LRVARPGRPRRAPSGCVANFHGHLLAQNCQGGLDFFRSRSMLGIEHAADHSLVDTQSAGQLGPKIEPPYTRAEVLEYHQLCRAEVEARVPALDLEAPSGFHWLPFNKLELQFYNIRHIQHHTGPLADRLRTVTNVGLAWVRPY
jgi:hypothetical protein